MRRQVIQERRPDHFELAVRRICGGVLGLVVGLGLCVSLWPLTVLWAGALVVGCVTVCGIGASKYGDDFWRGLKWWV